MENIAILFFVPAGVEGLWKEVPAMAASNKLHLPLHLKWSGPQNYDVSDPDQHAQVYEIVLREGRTEDLCRYLDLKELRCMWPDLFLPSHIRIAWEDYFARVPAQDGPALFTRESRDVFYTTLSPLQNRLARLLLSLPEAVHFALAGGAALIFRRAIPRATKDLDFFGAIAGEIRPAAESFLARLGREDLRAEVVSSSPAFVRLVVHDAGGEAVVVNIGRDSRLREPEMTEIGSVLTLEELAADKLLALFGRAEARDFVDVFYLARRFGIRALLAWAAEKDPGFDRYRLALSLGRLPSLPRREFELEEDAFDEMAEFYCLLRAELVAEAVESRRDAETRKR